EVMATLPSSADLADVGPVALPVPDRSDMAGCDFSRSRNARKGGPIRGFDRTGWTCHGGCHDLAGRSLDGGLPRSPTGWHAGGVTPMAVSSCDNRSAALPQPEPAVLAASDQRPRWRAGERMELLFEQRCDAMPDLLAVDPDTEPPLTFAELDARANRLARYLRGLGIGGGDRVGLLFDDAVGRYTAMLAVLKAGSAFVPLAPGLSPDRIGYIVEDAEVLAVLTL